MTQAGRSVVDQLESRLLLSVSQDSNGWTVVSPSSDSRVIYVSSSTGNDANAGLSASTPVKTIAKGESLLRNGMPDWLLLKRGDVWNGETFSTTEWNDWQKSGRSADEPMLLSAYGTGARPMLKAGTSYGLFTVNYNEPKSYVDIIGIDFYANTRDPHSPDYAGNSGSIGISLTGAGDSWLIEDCKLSLFKGDINVHGAFNNITIRRNVIVDAYSTDTHAQGLYADGVHGLTIEDNVFDHNGWNKDIVGAEPNIFNHNMYITAASSGVVVRNNIIANASSHGLQARGGGVIEGNLFLNNPIDLSFGFVNGAVEVTAGGVVGRVSGNVFIGSRDISGSPRGVAMQVSNIKPGAGVTINDNIIAHDTQPSPGAGAISLGYGTGMTNANEAVGINDLTIERNIVYDWYSAVELAGGLIPGGTGPQALKDLIVRNNMFSQMISSLIVNQAMPFNAAEETWQGNTYNDNSDPSAWFKLQGVSTPLSTWLASIDQTGSSTAPVYADPTRNMARYNASLGGIASDDAFLAQARLQSKANWRLAYTAQAAIAYIREGFYKSGDVNTDGNVTVADYITLAQHFNQSGQYWSTGDLNGDGIVTISDLIDLMSNFNVLT